MQPRDQRMIEKIISETEMLGQFVKDTKLEEFLSNEITKRAASMTLINIGELVKSLSPETRQTYNDIPCRLIAGFRDIAAHKYQTLNMTDVWNTITTDVPDLKAKLQAILKSDDTRQ